MCFGNRHTFTRGSTTTADAAPLSLRCACGTMSRADIAPVEQLRAQIERLNRLVETLPRALERYQQEEDEVGGDEPADHPYQRRGSRSGDDRCAVEGCTSKASAHPMNKTGPQPRVEVEFAHEPVNPDCEEAEAEIRRLRERLKIATEALEYIFRRNYTGAAFVAQEALKQMSVLE